MEVLDAKVYTFIGNPKLALLTGTSPPERDELRYQNEGEYWFAEKDGYVDYFVDSGNGGVSRTVTSLEGQERTFSNVGAGRASRLNAQGIGPYVDVKVTTEKEYYERGPGNMEKSAVTLKVAKEAAELAGIELERVEEDGEVRWVPNLRDE